MCITATINHVFISLSAVQIYYLWYIHFHTSRTELCEPKESLRTRLWRKWRYEILRFVTQSLFVGFWNFFSGYELRHILFSVLWRIYSKNAFVRLYFLWIKAIAFVQTHISILRENWVIALFKTSRSEKKNVVFLSLFINEKKTKSLEKYNQI